MREQSDKMPLPSNDELFELIVDSSTDFAIFTIDAAGTVTSWNVGAERVFGFSEDEMLGGCADLLFTPEDRASGAPARERAIARADGRALDERWHLRKDGSRFLGVRAFDAAEGRQRLPQDRARPQRAAPRLRATA